MLKALIYVYDYIFAHNIFAYKIEFLGLLPEEWDAVITKFVYPSFTPTVGLFLAGAVCYGVYKILQGNDSENN